MRACSWRVSVCFVFRFTEGRACLERKKNAFTGALIGIESTPTGAFKLFPLPQHHTLTFPVTRKPRRCSRGRMRRRRNRPLPPRRLLRNRAPPPPRAGADREVRASPSRSHPALPSRVHRPPPPLRWSSAARATWSRACCPPPTSRGAAGRDCLGYPPSHTLPHSPTPSHRLALALQRIAQPSTAWAHAVHCPASLKKMADPERPAPCRPCERRRAWERGGRDGDGPGVCSLERYFLTFT